MKTAAETFANLTSKHSRLDSQLEHVLSSRLDTTDRMIDGNFGNVSASVFISKVACQGKRW